MYYRLSILINIQECKRVLIIVRLQLLKEIKKIKSI